MKVLNTLSSIGFLKQKGSIIMVYLSNAFSLQMLDMSHPNTISTALTSIDDVKAALSESTFTSAIGHADTAIVVSNILNIPIDPNRISIKLGNDDILYVAQVVGGRLPEGATTIPAGMSISFIKVTLS